MFRRGQVVAITPSSAQECGSGLRCVSGAPSLTFASFYIYILSSWSHLAFAQTDKVAFMSERPQTNQRELCSTLSRTIHLLVAALVWWPACFFLRWPQMNVLWRVAPCQRLETKVATGSMTRFICLFDLRQPSVHFRNASILNSLPFEPATIENM